MRNPLDDPTNRTKAKGGVVSEELKPCPFCGDTAYVEENVRIFNKHRDDERDYGVRCENNECFCALGIDETTDFYGDMVYEFNTEEDAIKAWNTRSTQGEGESE